MKRILTISILTFCLMISAQAASKLTPEEYHFISLWGSAAYSTLLNNSGSTVKPGPGVSPALGVGYRCHYNGFLFQAGVEGQFQYLTSKLNASDIKLNMKDTEGENFIMHAAVSDCKDFVKAVNVQIPLAVGLERGSFYFLVGPKIGINMMASTASQSSLTTRGEYERFIDEFHDMPNHYFTSGQTIRSTDYKMKFNLNVMAHAEIGGRVDHFSLERGADVPKHNYRMYVALFAEYGFLNIHQDKTEGSALSYAQTDDGLKFFVVPAMVSSQLHGAVVNPLSVGVKFTVAFEMPKQPKCVICEQHQIPKHKSGGGLIVKD